MSEKEQLLKDYKDCLDRIINFEDYEYKDTELWALKKYSAWISKDQRYALAFTGGISRPTNEYERAWNSINHFKVVLDKIADINCIKIN